MVVLVIAAALLMSGPALVAGAALVDASVPDPIYQLSKGILTLARYVDIGRAALTGALVIKVMTDGVGES